MAESELRSKVVCKVKKFGQVNPVPRISTAEELADAILSLCREAAKGAIDDCAIFESYKERAKKAVDEALR